MVAMASLSNPLSSISRSRLVVTSETPLPVRSLRLSSLHSKKSSAVGGRNAFSLPSIVCKAVSVKPGTEVEGLNIAEDVTQARNIY
ncbi:hypothetical protein ACLOJK_011716 [Asimina triloba]